MFLVDNMVYWDVLENIGCCYVKVFGDFNLIYFYVVIVKFFGFFCVIVYGMWNKVYVIGVFDE